MPLNTLTNGLKVATGATGDGGVALNDNFTALDAVKGKADAATLAEFGYLSGVTSAIQTQLNAKAATSHTHATSAITSGTFADARIAASNVTQHRQATLRLPNAFAIQDDSNNEQIEFTKTASAVNHIGVTNAATGNGPKIEAAGSDTNIPLLLGKKGTGPLIAGDLTGNARGVSAVDIQGGRTGVTQVASGAYSSAFGYGNTVSGNYSSSAFGFQNTASGTYSSAFGYQSTASGEGSSAVGYGNTASVDFSSAIGYQSTASGANSSAIGHRAKTTIASTFEAGHWSNSTTRGGAIRTHPNGQVAFTIEDSATAPTDGGATSGSEADATLPRGMFSIQKNGTAVTLYFNNAGTIQSLSLGTLA